MKNINQREKTCERLNFFDSIKFTTVTHNSSFITQQIMDDDVYRKPLVINIKSMSIMDQDPHLNSPHPHLFLTFSKHVIGY